MIWASASPGLVAGSLDNRRCRSSATAEAASQQQCWMWGSSAAPRLVWRRAPPVLRLALAAFPLLSQLLRPEEEGLPCCSCVPTGYSQQAQVAPTQHT